MMKKTSNYRGMTLVEVILGVFVFSTIVLASTTLFTSSFQASTLSKEGQRKYESANTAINDIGKFLLTSTTRLTSGTSDSGNYNGSNSLVVYSYSTQECVEFTFTGSSGTPNDALQKRSKTMSDTEDYRSCSGSGSGGYLNGTTPITLIENIQGKFLVRNLSDASGSEHSGMVTIFARLHADTPATSDSFIPVQTTASLRDYMVE